MAERRVSFAPAARDDLTSIHAYIAERNPRAADRLLERIEEAIARLARAPGLGHRRPDVSDARYRFWVVARTYLIAYRYDDEHLTVVRILHGRRAVRGLLGQ